MQKLNTSNAAFIAKIDRLSTAVLWDKCYDNAVIINEDLINYTPARKLIGPAFIVNVENSILPVIQALDNISEDEVLVVNDLSENGDALLGDIIMSAARNQGVSGILVFGKVRDVDSAETIGIPVLAMGTTVQAAKLGDPVEQFPDEIVRNRQTIQQGDWLVADSDDLICIKKDKIRLVIKAAEIKNKQENHYIARLNDGGRIADMMNLKAYLNGTGELVIDF